MNLKIIILLLSLSVFFVACKNEADKHKGHTEIKESYTCPMHPQIIKDAPGNCPICGMKLVPKEDGKEKQAIKDEFLNGDLSCLKAQFKDEIQSQLRELADKIPSKKAELQMLSQADAQESERLLEEKADREKAESERIRSEEEKKKQDADLIKHMRNLQTREKIIYIM